MSGKQKLADLRRAMSKLGVDAYLVPSSDPHQSEYVPHHWERRKYLTGFTGSAGEAVVLAAAAALWTDGRYFLQAEQQLKGSGFKLQRMGMPTVPSIDAYLCRSLKAGHVVGFDPQVVSWSRARSLREALARHDIALKPLADNLVDEIWSDRPDPSPHPVSVWRTKFAGETVSAKLRRVRKALSAANADAHLVTMLDSIAWLFNLRGRDVDYNPVAIAYGLVTRRGAMLFVDAAKLGPDVRKSLPKEVKLLGYHRLASELAKLGKRKARVWVDPDSASAWAVNGLDGAELHLASSPIARMKAAKNPTELAGMRTAHVRDGVAVVRFLAWLSETVGSEKVSEVSAATKLADFRREGQHFQGLSFPTIAGYGEHGAIIHYSANAETDLPLKKRNILLVDSGAQYLDGTTDITRTVLLGGRATRHQKSCFTRVLKGHIRLATVKFPAGSPGARLDTLARSALWEVGLDYGHGTGHGVGAYLNVHEGPQSISFGRGLDAPLEPGNIQSNEPGYYEPGEFGIRIENLIEVVKDEALSDNAKTFHAFNTLTLCPIDTRLVDKSLLSRDEVAWLNAYHSRVRAVLGPRLDPKTKRWLSAACKRI